MRTLSASPIADDGPDDLDNRVIDGQDSLRQRVVQRLRFKAGTWRLDTRRGTEDIVGTRFAPQEAAAILTGAIRDEGGDEILNVRNVTVSLDRERVLTYRAEIDTVYGEMNLSGTVT